MKKVIFLMVLGFLIHLASTSTAAPLPPSVGGGAAVAVGVLSAIGIDPLGLGLGGSSSTTPAASPKASKDQSNTQMEFKALASLPASFDLLNQSAGGSLTTPEILK